MNPARKLVMVAKAEGYVRDLLRDELPDCLFYHDLRHTEQVVDAVLEISGALRLIPSEVEVLTLAAWFHDTGFVISTENHELHSCRIAHDFLSQELYPAWFIDKVIGCIKATKCPQTPSNLLEKVICDADMYHLSASNFQEMSNRLRAEWAALGKLFSHMDWVRNNLDFLDRHQYWTSYGKNILLPRKKQNIRKFLSLTAQ